MGEPYSIIDATLEDIEEICALEKSSFPTVWSRDSFLASLKREKKIFLVIRQNETFLGYSLSWIVADELHLLKIAIETDRRKQGLGKILLAETLEQAVENGVLVAWLEVRPTNQAALALYRACGFRAQFVRKDYYTDTREDAIVLVKRFGRTTNGLRR